MKRHLKFIIVSIPILLVSISDIGAQVLYDNSASAESGSGTSISTSYTVGTGSERLLVVGVSIFRDGSSRFVTSMTYNGVAMTFQTGVNNPDGKVRTEVWYLLNPATGSNTLTANFNTSTRKIIGITSFEGVDQTTPISATGSFAQDSGNPSTTIASESGGMVWDAVTRDNNGSWTAGALQTERWDTSSGSDLTSAGSTEPGSTSVTMSWTSDDSGQQVVQIAAAIKPSTSPPEICGNSIDDNNDGRVDEDIPGGVGGNLLLWLKADVGFSATTWQDQGPKNNDATVYGDPTQVTNSLNFNPGINFDGNDHVEVDMPELVFQSGNHSVALFIVYEPSTASTSIGIFGNQSSTGILGFQISNGNYGDGQALNSLPQAFGSTHHMISYIIDEEDNVGGGTNESFINHNGGLVTSFTFDENNVNDVDQNLHIGLSGANASSQYFQGDIHEIIVYYEWDGTAALTASEIEQVESYLATKYGITITHNYVDSQ